MFLFVTDFWQNICFCISLLHCHPISCQKTSFSCCPLLCICCILALQIAIILLHCHLHLGHIDESHDLHWLENDTAVYPTVSLPCVVHSTLYWVHSGLQHSNSIPTQWSTSVVRSVVQVHLECWTPDHRHSRIRGLWIAPSLQCHHMAFLFSFFTSVQIFHLFRSQQQLFSLLPIDRDIGWRPNTHLM